MSALIGVLVVICLYYTIALSNKTTVYILIACNHCFSVGYLANGIKPIRFCDDSASINRSNLVSIDKGENNFGKHQISSPETIEKSISVGNTSAFQSVAEKSNKLSSDDVIMYISDDIEKKSRPVGDISVKIEPILRSSYDKS